MSDPEKLTTLAEERLACPRCHGSLRADAATLACGRGCGFTGRIADGVVSVMPGSWSFFDARYQVMEELSRTDGVRRFCYDRQTRAFEVSLAPGSTVLDVGCGPRLTYARPPGVLIIGLDASLPSVRANGQLDLGVHGTALALPLPSASIDAVVALYAIHHLVGDTVAETKHNVRQAFAEFARVLKPGGDVFIFEISPWRGVSRIERKVWNVARRLLGGRLDMYFWSAEALADVGRVAFPRAKLSQIDYPAAPLLMFPPVFALPWLQIPRFLYPFDARLYHWHLNGDARRV